MTIEPTGVLPTLWLPSCTQFGDEADWPIYGNPVETVIKTDQGDVAYGFD
jgi:hypothetical protein